MTPFWRLASGHPFRMIMLQHYLVIARAFFEHLGTDAETAFRHSFALAQPILDHYGYLAVFIAILVEGFGVPAPGQTILMAGAILAARGEVSIALVLVLAFLVLKSVGVLEDRKQSLQQILEASGFTQITLTHNLEPDSTKLQAATQPQKAKIINVANEIEKLVGHIESKLTLGRIGPIGIVLLIWTALTLLTEMMYECLFPLRHEILFWSGLNMYQY